MKQESEAQSNSLNKQIQELTDSLHDKDMLIQVANQQIQNHQKIEDKLKNQLVEVEKNQKISSNELEANLT